VTCPRSGQGGGKRWRTVLVPGWTMNVEAWVSFVQILAEDLSNCVWFAGSFRGTKRHPIRPKQQSTQSAKSRGLGRAGDVAWMSHPLSQKSASVFAHRWAPIKGHTHTTTKWIRSPQGILQTLKLHKYKRVSNDISAYAPITSDPPAFSVNLFCLCSSTSLPCCAKVWSYRFSTGIRRSLLCAHVPCHAAQRNCTSGR
jgi:hypothetical protein